MTDTITISAGRANRQGDEKDFSGDWGTYLATLFAVTDEVTAESTQPRKGPRDDGTWTYRDWTFALDGGPNDGEVIDVRANARSTGPKSKQYEIISALVGRTPPVGAQIEIRKHLIGRQCYLAIGPNDAGYPTVTGLMALPNAAPAPAAAPAASLPPEPTPEPAATAPVASGDDLPF